MTSDQLKSELKQPRAGVYYRLHPETKQVLACELTHCRNEKIQKTKVWRFTVSTVFLGIDHDFFKTNKAPVVFETMIFSDAGPNQFRDYQTRCSTHEEALEMHRAAVKEVSDHLYRETIYTLAVVAGLVLLGTVIGKFL